MIRILCGDSAPVANLVWSVYKCASMVLEDFSHAKVFLWLVGAGNKWLVECSVENGKIEAVIPKNLPVGVYGVRATWVKDSCYKRCFSEVDKVFGVTDDPAEANPVVGDSCTICVTSFVATYGYDGLSAYELAVLDGKTTLSEDEWLDMCNTGFYFVELTQEMYDALPVKDKRTIYLIVERLSDTWVFGDPFPIVFTDGGWTFGSQFPVVFVG